MKQVIHNRRKHSRSLHHLYALYHNRCIDQGIEPVDKKHWIKVCTQFTEDLYDYLLEGYTYIIPASIGTLRLTKKLNNRVRFPTEQEYTKEELQAGAYKEAYKKYVPWDVERYTPMIAFDTTKQKYPNRTMFRFRLAQRTFKKINQAWEKDRNLLFNYPNYNHVPK